MNRFLIFCCLLLCLPCTPCCAGNGGRRGIPQHQEGRITLDHPAGPGRNNAQLLKSAQALRHPLLAGKLERQLLNAWKKASSENAKAAIQLLRAKHVVLAKNGRDVVVILSLAENAKLQLLETQLRNFGATILRAGPDTIKAAAPPASLAEIALLPDVLTVRAIKPPRMKNTSTTEGLTKTLANAWHTAGFTGQNVKLAIVDSSFANLASLKAQDEIPSTAIEVNYTGTPMADGDDSHGCACAEIVYDMAPDVQMFLIKVDDPTDLLAVKDYCIANGIKIVSCSLGWDALNFHDGIAYANWFTTVANHPVTAVNLAQAGGILWVTSAGNEQEQHTLIDWRDGGTPDNCLDWNSSHENLNRLILNGSYTIPAGTLIDIYLTWNKWPVSNQDFDLELYCNTGSGWEYMTGSTDTQDGSITSYPYEEIYGYETPVSGQYAVCVFKYNASTSPKFILRYYGVYPDYFGYDNYTTPAPGSIAIPADAASAFTVGALDQATYPAGPIEYFSSLGPNNRAFTGGSAVVKPDICGPDRTTSAAYGGAFTGTSASAPHIAGLAALVRGAYPGFTPAQTRSFIETNGLDLGSAGKDNTYGSGAARLPSPPLVKLTVTSPWGGADPAGTNFYYLNREVSVMVTNSPSLSGTTQAVCKGWTGTGSAPRTGSTTNTGSFIITNDSSVAWLWSTNFWLDTATNGNGSVNVADSWWPKGSNAQITAFPAEYSYFAGWTGQTNGCTISGNVIKAPMTQPRTITAKFMPQCTFVIATQYGQSVPPIGTNWYTPGVSVSARLTNSPVLDGTTTQYVCRGWSGSGSVSASGTSTNTGTFTITTNSTLTWVWRTNFWLDVNVTGAGSLSAGDGWLANGTNFLITATPSNHWHFFQWTGQTNGCLMASNKITVAMDGPRLITAGFLIDSHKLTVSTPHGLANPPAGTNWFNYGSSNTAAITNNPITDGGMQFVCRGWTGTGSIPVTGTTTQTAPFSLTNDSSITWKWGTNFLLHTTINGSGSVTGGDNWYAAGSNAVITAVPAPAGRFIGWSGDTNGCTIASNRLTALMDRVRTNITANFVNMYCVVVSSPFDQSSPGTGTNWFDSGASCMVAITNPTVISGGSNQYTCAGWLGSGSAPPEGSSMNTGSFTVTNDSRVVWQWATNFWLNVKTNGFGTVSVNNQWCPAGTNIIIRADSTDYGRFIDWSGQLSGSVITSNELALVMDGARSVTADFSSPPLKMRIRFTGYSKTSALTNFPLLVAFDPAKLTNGFSYRTFTSTNGSDLRFQDEAGTTDLNFEIENWNTNGISSVWVQVPVLTKTGSIWASWGDAGMASAMAPCTTNGSTWEAGFKGVWHLAENEGHAMDSTRLGATALVGSNVVRTAGRIAGGAGFTGSNNSDFAASTCFDLTNRTVTLETWAYVDSSKHGAFLKIGNNSTGYALGLGGTAFENAGQKFLLLFEGVRWIQPATTVGTGWHHFAMVIATNGTPEGFLDGASVGSFSGTLAKAPTGAITRIGGYATDTAQRHFNGLLDEVRISAVPRSADWLWACRMTVASNSVFSQYDAPTPAGRDLYGIPDTWKLQYFNGVSMPNGHALDDWDHDGLLNLEEYLAGTIPTNWFSKLEFIPPQAGPSGTNFVMRWSSVTGKFYAVDAGTNIMEGFPFNLSNAIPATPDVNSLTIRVDRARQEFFRVRLQP